jgi:hypothetical protein
MRRRTLIIALCSGLALGCGARQPAGDTTAEVSGEDAGETPEPSSSPALEDAGEEGPPETTEEVIETSEPL